MKEIDESTLWYSDKLDVYLNRWFAKYEEARGSLDSEGGYLLPYRHQFFVCEFGAINALGLDADDPDWKKIGCDCVKPVDLEAYERLSEKRRKVLQAALG
jgi:hypothetical protein